MFNIGFTEILVIGLVSIVAIDKEKIPAFIGFVRAMYRYAMNIRSKAKKLLRDAGIEELYDTEGVTYITGKDGKKYPSYNMDNTPDDSKNSSGR